jgi:transposase-like protein
VERCLAGDRTIGQVAGDFDLVESAVQRWVEQAQIDAGERGALTSDEREELASCGRRTAGQLQCSTRQGCLHAGDQGRVVRSLRGRCGPRH